MCSTDKPSIHVILCVTHDGLGRCEATNYIASRVLFVAHGTCGVFTRMLVLFSLFKSEKRTQNGRVPGRFRSRPRGGASPLLFADQRLGRGGEEMMGGGNSGKDGKRKTFVRNRSPTGNTTIMIVVTMIRVRGGGDGRPDIRFRPGKPSQ